MNLNKLYKNAARLCNIVAANEALLSEDLEIAEDCLKALLETWSLNPKLQWGRDVVTIATDGSTNDLVLPSRPVAIHAAQWSYTASGNVFFNLNQIDEVTFYKLNFRNITAPPNSYYWDRKTTLHLFPIPSSGLLTLVVQNPLVTDFTDLETDLNLPPGYDLALKYSLAVLLMDEYGKADTQNITAKAGEAVSNIQVQNQRPEIVKQGLGNMFGKGGYSSGYYPLINKP